VLVPQPSLIEDYNFGIRGTDGIDQTISYYRNEMRCKKWQPRLLMHFIRAAVTKANILFKLQTGAERGDDGFALLDLFPDMYRRRAEDASSDMSRSRKMCGKKVPVRCGQCNVPL
jgi:hypothetical protein